MKKILNSFHQEIWNYEIANASMKYSRIIRGNFYISSFKMHFLSRKLFATLQTFHHLHHISRIVLFYSYYHKKFHTACCLWNLTWDTSAMLWRMQQVNLHLHKIKTSMWNWKCIYLFHTLGKHFKQEALRPKNMFRTSLLDLKRAFTKSIVKLFYFIFFWGGGVGG